MTDILEEKKDLLGKYLYDMASEDLAVAFSGGVDSSLLLKVACKAAAERGTGVYAVTFDTWLHPKSDAKVAARVAAECGAVHVILSVDEREIPELMNNPVDRCYLCKRHLFKSLKKWAADRGITYLLEGTNYDDTKVRRPGRRALTELGVRSPLAELEITKAQVRAMAAELRLSVAERPSTPCMATRLPYGAKLDGEVLKRIEQGEARVRQKGFSRVRLRFHEPVLRIEVLPEEFPRLMSMRDELSRYLKELGFEFITLDLEGFRSGSMDIGISDETQK